MKRRFATLVLFGWILLEVQRNGAWEPTDTFSSESTCLRVREAIVAEKTLAEIGSALASQPADNPLRRQAYERTARRVSTRYECAPERR
jgi:hypothetical protein